MTRTAGLASTASATMVSGTHRYKYFKRPIMPRVNAYPPQVLLAPTNDGAEGSSGQTNNPLVPVPPVVEAQVKDAGIQTMYRDSEAQTTPYTPEFVVAPGENPEILLLKDMTYRDGLPIGKREIEMIEYARAKKDLELNLPPFTDEASLLLRKRLMEQQELKEFTMREKEIDEIRHEKLDKLAQALQDREASSEFMTSQRLESVRLQRMAEREQQLEKIRHKRIKALRRIARERGEAEPVLSQSAGGAGTQQKDIIDRYFDKGSHAYAPLKREGRMTTATNSNSNTANGNNQTSGDVFDISSRTVPLDSITHITALEATMPRRLLNSDDNRVNPALLAKTSGGGVGTNTAPIRPNDPNRVKAAEPRLTSAAQRSLRMTKRDVEEMHQILMLKKKRGTGSATGGALNDGPSSTLLSSLLAKKPKGRPPTPDLTQERSQVLLPPAPVLDASATATFEQELEQEQALQQLRLQQQQQQMAVSRFHFDDELQLAATLLQRLLRGRAVQNIMFEGKYRRRELIRELQAADEAQTRYEPPEASRLDAALKQERAQALRESTLEAFAGSAASNLLHTLSEEQSRVDLFAQLMQHSEAAIIERREVEAAEAGRRQRQGMKYPPNDGEDLHRPHITPDL